MTKGRKRSRRLRDSVKAFMSGDAEKPGITVVVEKNGKRVDEVSVDSAKAVSDFIAATAKMHAGKKPIVRPRSRLARKAIASVLSAPNAKYHALGVDESVLGRVVDGDYAYLDSESGVWIQHPEVYQLVQHGAVWYLPAELWFAFPGHAREITLAEAEEFLRVGAAK